MMTIKKVKTIAGSVKLPSNPDCFFLSCVFSLVTNTPVHIKPWSNSPLIKSWINALSGHCIIQESEQGWQVEQVFPVPDKIIHLDYSSIPFPEFVIFCICSSGRSLHLAGISPKRIDQWEKICTAYSIRLISEQRENGYVLRMQTESGFCFPDQMDANSNDVHILCGLALALQKKFSLTGQHFFQSPLRNLFTEFGYQVFVRNLTDQKAEDPFERRMRLHHQKNKRINQVCITVDCTTRKQATIGDCILPGDDLLGALLLMAKSLIPKGSLIITGVPLETWACSTMHYIKKMGCTVGMQEEGRTTFGPVGMINVQKFSLVGRKVDCTPLYLFRRQLPVLASLAAYSHGQSVFRGLLDLHNDEPDPIEQILRSVRSMGGRHGEMPDGMIIEGGKDFDGFDISENFSSCLNGACMIAGMRCNGVSNVNEDSVLHRWPDFLNLIESIGEQA